MQMPYAYTGTVTDNKDEDGLNRVKVSAQLDGGGAYLFGCPV